MNVEDMEIGIEAGLAFAEPLFDVIGERSFDGIGFTRAAYGPGEQMAHNVVAQAGRDLGLRVELDAALNLSMTLAGKDGNKPPLMIGSHLDAVPQGEISTAWQVCWRALPLLPQSIKAAGHCSAIWSFWLSAPRKVPGLVRSILAAGLCLELCRPPFCRLHDG